MPRNNTFRTISRKMLDAWLMTSRDKPAAAEDVYRGVVGQMSVRMRITQFFPTDGDPLDWWMKPVHHNGPITRIPGFKSLFFEGKIGAFRDRDYIQSALIPTLTESVATQSPSIEVVKAKLVGFGVVYDRIILPQRHPDRPEWVLSYTNGRLLISDTGGRREDVVDDLVVQLLIEGLAVKEIAEQTNLSQRTIEHRIERMRDRHGARNVTQLVAMMVAANFLDTE
jgi:hypothetical protein